MEHALHHIKILSWKNWSVRQRLMVIAIFPVIYLFFSVVSYSYFAHEKEASLELAERGNIVATALAEGLEYPLVSGNTNGLKQMVHGVVQSDQSIFKIEVFNLKRESLSSALRSGKNMPENRYFEKPIQRQMIWVNIVDQTPTLVSNKASNSNSTGSSIGSSSTEKTKFKKEIIGYVRVTMSPTHMVEKQKHRFGVELLISLLALAVSVWVGLFLSQSLTQPLKQSIDVLRQIRGGDTEQKMAITTGGEIGDLQHSINDMAESLHLAKQHLEKTVEQRTSELMQSRNEALKANAEKRKLIQKVNTIVEEERQSIAIEIHDELNASLIAVRLESERIAKIAGIVIKAEQSSQPNVMLQEIQERARTVIQLALHLYANGRNLVRRLRPEVLDMLGLQGAVEEMIRMFNEAQKDCHFSFVTEGDFTQVNKEMAMSCYRIIQEASSNALKHAQAKNIKITLSVDMSQSQSVVLNLVIQDDGIGFDQDLVVPGIGIVGMRERVAALNGTMQIESKSVEGSKIMITMSAT